MAALPSSYGLRGMVTGAGSAAIAGALSGGAKAAIPAAVCGGLAGLPTGDADTALAGIVGLAVGGAMSKQKTGALVSAVYGLSGQLVTAFPLNICATAAVGAVQKVSPSELLPAATALIARTDGVDKVAKITQNVSRIAAARASDEEQAAGYQKLAAAAGTARGMLCMGQWIGTAPKILPALSAASSPLTAAHATRQIATLAFQFGDNVSFLSKHRVLDCSPTPWSLLARRACLIAYCCDAAMGVAAALGGARRGAEQVLRALLDIYATARSTEWLPAVVADSIPPISEPLAGLGAATIAVQGCGGWIFSGIV
eukprot:Sspe_Gene.51423::Locus_28547_Transcript_1_1_Confidence_1.000_Length_1290::g.51423::m.51423